MATQMQLRGGTTAENLLFTGAQREITVDTDKHSIVVHDGVTAGGYPMATSPQVTNGTIYFNDNVGGGSAANAYILVPKSNTNVPTMYTDGLALGFTTANPNTGPSTASFQGLGVKSLKYRGGADPAAGDINGRVDLVYDLANDWFEIQRKVTPPAPQISNFVASVSSNTLILGIAPQILDFRNVTPGIGSTVSRTLVSQASLTVPSGATLGTSSGVAATLVLLAIDAGGVVEAAIANMASGFTFDESTPITTVAISGAATSASVIYSATARASVSYRVVAVINSTQAAAGTWATNPTKVQGMGGAAYSLLKPADTPRAWSDVSASRSFGVGYTNSTTREIIVSVVFDQIGGGNTNLTVGGLIIAQGQQTSVAGYQTIQATVPAGATYQVDTSSNTKRSWKEFR